MIPVFNVFLSLWPVIFRKCCSTWYRYLSQDFNFGSHQFPLMLKTCVCGAGAKAHADILKLVATLLVLQLMRVEKLEEGKLLRTLFCLNDPSQSRSDQNQTKQHQDSVLTFFGDIL